MTITYCPYGSTPGCDRAVTGSTSIAVLLYCFGCACLSCVSRCVTAISPYRAGCSTRRSSMFTLHNAQRRIVVLMSQWEWFRPSVDRTNVMCVAPLALLQRRNGAETPVPLRAFRCVEHQLCPSVDRATQLAGPVALLKMGRTYCRAYGRRLLEEESVAARVGAQLYPAIVCVYGYAKAILCVYGGILETGHV